MNRHYDVACVDALDLPVPRFPVKSAQDAGGEPSVGSVDVFSIDRVTVGIWELGVGAIYDVEIDEIFVVLAGDAHVETLDPSGLVTEKVLLRPGILCRLHAGTRTRWTVRHTLRNVFIVPKTSP